MGGMAVSVARMRTASREWQPPACSTGQACVGMRGREWAAWHLVKISGVELAGVNEHVPSELEAIHL